MKLSQHCIKDREERLVHILLHIPMGMGEEVARLDKGDRWEILTNTGVVMIKAKDRDFLITAYIASMKRAIYIFRTAFGNKRMPDYLYSRVEKNQKIAKDFVMKFGTPEEQAEFRKGQKPTRKR